MRKVVGLLSLVMGLVIGGCAGLSVNSEGMRGEVGMKIGEVFKMGYESGLKEGREIGYVSGYADAVEDFKRLLKEYEKELEAISAGRVLLKEWRISYPKVFQVNKGGRFEIVVEGCEPLMPLSEEILKKVRIPIKEGQKREVREEVKEEKRGGDYIKREEHLRSPVMKRVSKELLQEVLRLGYPFLNDVEKGEVQVYFPDERTAEIFCAKYKCL